jgi:hypothetical protein
VIAYLLLVHRFPEQFKRLFRAIYDPANHYLIHVDKGSGQGLEDDLRDFLGPYGNAAILDSQRAQWGGWSLVDAELRGMAQLLRMGATWTHFINLSGQDFPLRTQAQIAGYLAARPGQEFIKVLDQRVARPETMGRIAKVMHESQNAIVETGETRSFLAGARPYIGNQWMIVSRRFCQFVCHDPQADRFKAFYRDSFIPDEGFFQTVMMNTSAHGEIVRDDLRNIDWVADGDIKLRPRVFTLADGARLGTGANLFARKFDAGQDSEILDLLEHRLKLAETPVVRLEPLGWEPVDDPLLAA